MLDAATAFPFRDRLLATFARGGHVRAVGLSRSWSLPDGADFADRWLREPMPWTADDRDAELFALVSELARLRTTTPAPTAGSYVEVAGDGEVWVFERRDAATRLLVTINTGDAPATVARPGAPLGPPLFLSGLGSDPIAAGDTDDPGQDGTLRVDAGHVVVLEPAV